ncbi:hypothetical protein B0T14DRAFT_497089 [Immersiella caudata]|uniref:Uncharacterized protein n=1 Tax=Immersiella caudata TaxID=314043 RepID=A0AA40C0I9_9PEZI|nr:hypothetical protein B0T14DRAFT_497089 [Immersiella caudata]
MSDCIQPDTDVAGIGVVVAYSLHSMLVLFISMVFTWLRHKVEAKQGTHNPDFGLSPRVEALGSLLIQLMDQQPILAVALLVGTYVKRTPTSAYHLKMVQYLINLSTVSYVVTVGFSPRQIRMPWYRILAFLALIIAWIVPSALSTWDQVKGIGCPQQGSVMPRDDNDEFYADPAIGLAIIVFMVLTILLATARAFRARLEAPLKNPHDPHALREAGFGRRCCQFTRAMYYFYLVTIGLSFIISNIQTMRRMRERFSHRVGDVENEWGYGQVLALALVLMPAVEFAAACFRK